VTLLEVYEAIEGPLQRPGCLLGRKVCTGSNCILGNLVVSVDQQVRKYLSKTHLTDLAKVYGEEHATKIIRIDESKCNGCGKCVKACAEGALKIIDGKARVVSETFCDGLGACIGDCPQGALTIEEREASAFDEKAVAAQMQAAKPAGHHHNGCPGSAAKVFAADRAAPAADGSARPSRLSNWPVQLKLAPVEGPLFDGADLLVCADCVPYALANFHEQLLAGRIVLIGCPKLDDPAFYADKLTAILQANNIHSITVAHMEVPCCNGIVYAVRQAMERSGKNDIALSDVAVGIHGGIL
jgi:ferredoxin